MDTLAKNYCNTGKTVVYRKGGIYKITGFKEQKIGDIKKKYYVLSSVYDKNTTIYVPMDNDLLTSQIEPVLTKEEINSIIDKSEEKGIGWIEDTTRRAVFFEEILKSGELYRILALFKLLYLRRENAEPKTYRTYARDEKAFALASKAITEAFAYPLEIPKTEVVAYITERITKNQQK